MGVGRTPIMHIMSVHCEGREPQATQAGGALEVVLERFRVRPGARQC